MASLEKTFWQGKRVLVTGHTGFKGSWLCLCLGAHGAELYGYALAPPTEPSLFDLARVGELLTAREGDVRDYELLRDSMAAWQPEIIFHLAAQSLVRRSFREPIGTYATNVLGTAHLLEAIRDTGNRCVVVNVTSDKCYRNEGRSRGYREDAPLGGGDPYSSSKACAELLTAAYRDSFFSYSAAEGPRVALASARAGNAVGGGDWAGDRLLPDCIRALTAGQPVAVRNPQAVRPWQHVLEPLSGYLLLAERLWSDPPTYSRAWNFGPCDDDAWPVHRIVEQVIDAWGSGTCLEQPAVDPPDEAPFLALDSSLAHSELGWQPRTNLRTALRWTVDWHRRVHAGEDPRGVTCAQIEQYYSGDSLND